MLTKSQYAFVISKPPALYTDLPTTLSQLRHINERDLLKALPVDRPREWLIASHIPWLLSYQVADNQNILNWAASLTNATIRNPDDQTLSGAARTLYQVSQVFQRRVGTLMRAGPA